MSDPRIEILDALKAAVEAATGYTVEMDRQKPVAEFELPLVVIDQGGEETAPLASTPAHARLWAMRWQMSPVVTVYIYNTNPGALRAAVSDAYIQIVRAVRDDATIHRLAVRDALIGAEMTPITPDENSTMAGASVTFSITYDRNI